MSASVVAGIFNNSITRWDDPLLQADNTNLQLPRDRITVVVPSDKSGMTETLTQYLNHNNPSTWTGDAVGKPPAWPLPNHVSLADEPDACLGHKDGDDDPTAWNLEGTGQTGVGVSLLRRPYSIGYLELGYFSALTDFVVQAHVSNAQYPRDFEAATLDTLTTTMDGLYNKLDESEKFSLTLTSEDTPTGGYPISRYLYWYIKGDSKEYKSCCEAWLIYKFIEWTYTDPLVEEVSVGHGFLVP